MEGFIDQVAKRLYEEYGEDISSLNVLFPSRRARLFFNDSLSKITTKPLWAPKQITIDQVMEKLSGGLSVGDHIRLITELYVVYSKYHDESFDSFYFWGEMLLSDFDSIDKYLIDVDMLFRNVLELKEIESTLSYLTKEQREIVSKFWRTLESNKGEFSEEKQKFLNIWRTLLPIYNEFRERIASKGIAYTGMMHREVVERIIRGEIGSENSLITEKREAKKERYAVIGFNALTKCEKTVFKYLSKEHSVDFFWDYDKYYLDNKEQEAGLFLRENVKEFPQRLTLNYEYDRFSEAKNITVVSVPSDSLQCKYTTNFINNIISRSGRTPDKESAIVLTDENMLIPTLHSIPSEVEDINVTMGYPLRKTTTYTFVERLIQLQSSKREYTSRLSFHHSDISGLLTHPFVMEACSSEATKLAEEIVERQQIYITTERFEESENELLKIIFSPINSWLELGEYINKVLSRVLETTIAQRELMSSREYFQRVEFISIISENVVKLLNVLSESSVELTMKMFASLLRKTLQNISISYEGEPLKGVQVMGILETRNLDFENVLILSANDDTFPGNRATVSSFIPHNLRFAYGLPTPQHHEGVYAYYFYRLLQRAKNVDIVYCSRSDEKSSGEQSRYIYQLEYESPHSVKRVDVGLDVVGQSPESITIDKKGRVWEQLQRFLIHDNRERENGEKAVRLSPTAFSNYVACPLKFYFYSIARLAPEEELSEQVDAPMFGSILHGAMERLYAPFLNMPYFGERIKQIGNEQIEEAVDKAVQDEFFGGDSIQSEEYSGNLLLARDIVMKYISTCILPYDAKQTDCQVSELEKRVEYQFEFKGDSVSQQKLKVLFGGIVDRIDTLSDGRNRVIDYKSGKQLIEFKGVDALFSTVHAEQNPAALQTLLYSMILNKERAIDIQPAIYYVRNLNEEEYSPLLFDAENGAYVESYLDYKDSFENKLSTMLADIFNPELPFTQCEDEKHCGWCDFNVVCRRVKQ